MRILAVGPLPPKADGLADYTLGVMTAQAQAGHDVMALTDSAGADEAYVLGRFALSPMVWSHALRQVFRARPDVVHVQHAIATYALRLFPLWSLVLLARARGARVVVTHHEVTRDIARLGRVGRWYYRLVSSWCDVVHVHTAKSRRTMVEELGTDPARVVEHPHPIFPPTTGRSASEMRQRHHLEGVSLLLQLGFVQVEKGLRELVEGLALLVRRRPELPVHLVVAGGVRVRPPALARFEQADHDYLADVKARVSSHGLAERVTFTGHVPEEEMTAWLTAADLVTLPYTAIEQSGIANRAIAAGTPVLATRSGGLGALLDPLPALPSLSPRDVADALERSLSDLDATRDAATAAYKDVLAAADPALLVGAITPGKRRR